MAIARSYIIAVAQPQFARLPGETGVRIGQFARHWLGKMNGLGYELAFRLWELAGNRHPRLAQPLFFLGCPRSGTTLAVELFARHPDVVNLSEAQEIWDPLHHLDPEADHHWPAEKVTPEDARRLHARFEFHRRLHRARRLVNKNPRNSVRVAYLRAVFPDARFLHLIRDGRAVAHSLVEETRRDPERQRFPFGNFCKPPNWRTLLREDPLEQAALQWREILRTVRDARPILGSSYLELRYEELCEDPRGVLRRAYDFAGLRTDDDTLKRLPPRLESQNFKWRTALRRQQIETLHRIQAPLLQELGYPL